MKDVARPRPLRDHDIDGSMPYLKSRKTAPQPETVVLQAELIIRRYTQREGERPIGVRICTRQA